ncbi:hypothetical protein ABZ897_32665 [Nonomuraea sp. NPDC046802]|uniref:hypothetical protein n=1 Tax=Nonomuraea sp. NPDC046802 TaxID=3154919 RepID=UPI0033D1EEBE
MVTTGILMATTGSLEYVDRGMPAALVISAGLATIAAGVVAGVMARARRVLALAALPLLLPITAQLLFHGLRLTGLIPLPVDSLGLVASALAAMGVVALWIVAVSGRSRAGGAAVPIWVVWVGVAASLLYPIMKVSWLLGSPWLAPAGTDGVLDGAFIVPVGVGLVAALSCLFATRWWNSPAPGWAPLAATLGGLLLTGIGLSGLMTAIRFPDTELTGGSGPLIYASWLVWGVCSIAISQRLSTRRPRRS